METAPPPTASAAIKTAAPSAVSAVSEAALQAAVAATAKALVSAVEASADLSAESVVPAQTHKRPGTVSAEDKTCFKCGKVLQSRLALRLHLNRVNPCDQPQGGRKDGKSMWDRYGSKTCPKCSKTFTTTAGLRLHLSRVNPCDAPKPADLKPHIYQCEKCGEVFSSAQRLRKHFSRVFPCDDPNGERTGVRAGQGGRTCPKCNKTFASRQSLRVHLNRVTPCDAVPSRGHGKARDSSIQGDGRVYSCPGCEKPFTTEHGMHIHMGRNKACIPTIPFTTALSSESGSERKLNGAQDQEEQAQHSGNDGAAHSEDAESSASMSSTRTQEHTGTGPRSFAKLAAQSSWQQLHYQSFLDSTADALRSTDRMGEGLSRKRSVDRSNEGLSPVEEGRKRACTGVGPFAELVDRLSKGGASVTSSQKVTHSPTRIAVPTSNLSGSHGGDILTDGCCCRACVRMWARETTIRLEKLKGEVATMRGAIVRGSMNEEKEKASANVIQEDSSAEVPEQDSELSTSAPSSSKTSECDVEDPVKASLVEKYDQLNDRIITNERALEDSTAYLKKITNHDESSSLELRNQIDELRLYINVEKGKRDEAVAAILAHRWNSKRREFGLLLENMVVNSRPDADKVFHEDCMDIATQLAGNSKSLLQLSTPEQEQDTQGEDSAAFSKVDIEKSIQQHLENERDSLFMRLLRSSDRINLLTKEKFGVQHG